MSDKYEVGERSLSSLKFRVTLFFFFFFIAIFGIFIITSVMEVNTVITFIGSRIAVPSVQTAAGLIDGDAFERLSKSLDKNDPYYESARLKLLDLKQRNGCAFLFTMAKKTESIYSYIIDGSAPPEDMEHFSALGAEENIGEWDAAVFDALREKKVLLGSIDQQAGWGALISAYGPIFNSKGDVVGLIGCDLEADPIIQWIRTRVFWQLGIVAAFILAGLVVYLLLLRKIDKTFKKI